MSKIIILVFAIILSSCNTEPEAIKFGKSSCDYCMMTIMDRKFGAELITVKGRRMKFDSGECMLRYIKSHSNLKTEKTFMINYSNPEELINAETAVYLHGGNVKSPMGGNLASFKTKEDAEKLQKDLGGDELSWTDILKISF